MAKLHEPPAECKESLAALRGRRACSSFPGAQTQPNELDRKIDRDPSRRKEGRWRGGRTDGKLQHKCAYPYLSIYIYTHTYIYIYILFFFVVCVCLCLCR